jgi:rhodanese-related sulfurtransferase
MSTTTEPFLTADDVLADVRSTARAMIRGGCCTFDQVLARALELAALADDAPRAGRVERVVRLEWEAQAAALAAADDGRPSDDVRVERAFANLERVGVATRLGWSCCPGCGERELRRLLPDQGAYAFVTEPDLERLASGSIVVHCSSAGVGRRVAAALVAQGLRARDDGADVTVRITAWRKPLPGAA